MTDKYGKSSEGHSKKGTRSVIETEERRPGDVVVGCGSAGKHTEEEIGEEEVGYAEG